MKAELEIGIASAWMFVGFATATGLFIITLERRESKLKKKKLGVYKPGKEKRKQSESALNAATEDLLRHTNAELGHEGGRVDGPAASEALLRQLKHAAAEKQHAWDAVPSVGIVADEAARAQASAGTEEWLQKAHELLREGLEGEKEWTRDPNDDLFLIGKQAAAGRKAQANTPRTPPPKEDQDHELPTNRHSARASDASSFADSASASFARPPTLAAASERDLLTRGMKPTPKRAVSTLQAMDGLRGASMGGDGIRRVVRPFAFLHQSTLTQQRSCQMRSSDFAPHSNAGSTCCAGVVNRLSAR